MFVFADEVRFPWTVRIFTPHGDSWRTGEFTAVFRMPTTEEADEAFGSPATITALAVECLVGWERVADVDGVTPLPYSDEAKARIVRHTHTRRCLVDAFLEAIGRPPDTVGNSVAPRSTGSAAPVPTTVES